MMKVKKLLNNNNYNFMSMRLIVSTLLIIFGILPIISASNDHIDNRKYFRYTDVNDDSNVNVNAENTRPIIGILAQEVSQFILRNYPNEKYDSYIAASYVKYVEGAGGRAVPIWIGKGKEYYVDIMSKINGVLMPGGASFFNKTGGYADAGKYIYDIAINMNDHGIHMPIWGTCLGYELLIHRSLNGTDLRSRCTSSAQALPLEFEKGYNESRLFGSVSDDLLNYMSKYKITPNFHIFCYTKETFNQYGLNKVWRVLSVNHDWNGKEFISTVEHVKYPFYGVQYHPEKNIYEFVPNRNITHTSQAILVSQYFANFFMNEARKNGQKFSNSIEEMNTLFYNYQPLYTGAKGSAFAQSYVFPARNGSTATNNAAEITKLTFLLTLITLFVLEVLGRV